MNYQQEEKSLQLPAESWSKPEVHVLDIKEETLGAGPGNTDNGTQS